MVAELAAFDKDFRLLVVVVVVVGMTREGPTNPVLPVFSLLPPPSFPFSPPAKKWEIENPVDGAALAVGPDEGGSGLMRFCNIGFGWGFAGGGGSIWYS